MNICPSARIRVYTSKNSGVTPFRFALLRLPDLRINNVQYRIEKHEIDTDRPDQPQMTLMGLLDIVLTIQIENIGSGNWDNDICLLCTLEEEQNSEDRFILYENLIVPYATRTEIIIVLAKLIRQPTTITVNLNLPDVDSLTCDRFTEENFYNNNLFKLSIN